MSITYFIDSENVGDNWIALLDGVTSEDVILVFYTSKSPNMNYRNVILLKQSNMNVRFIECFEGSNALDFQLCTELGCRIPDLGENEFIIVSNDTGFDAVVKYWRIRNKAVKRIHGKACNFQKNNNLKGKAEVNHVNQRKELEDKSDEVIKNLQEETQTEYFRDELKELSKEGRSDNSEDKLNEALEESLKNDCKQIPELSRSEALKDDIEQIPDMFGSRGLNDVLKEEIKVINDNPEDKKAGKSADESEETQKEEYVHGPDNSISENINSSLIDGNTNGVDENSKEILYIIGKNNLQDLHESLKQLYGDKKSKSIYNAFKTGNAYNNFLMKHPQMNPKEKQAKYCSIVFSIMEPNEVMPEDFPKFIVDSWAKKKNLNSLRSMLQQKYGREKSDRYYSLFKVHIKILHKIK